MVEVAIQAVEAVFDWKQYLKEAFGYEVDDSWLKDYSKVEEIEEEEDFLSEAEDVAIEDSKVVGLEEDNA